MSAIIDPDFPCAITLDIPFLTQRLASAAMQSIAVDPELSGLVRRQFSLVQPSDSASAEEHILRVQYKATTNRMLRVAVNSFMDSLKLVVEVMEQLDIDVLEQSQSKAPQS